MWGGPGEGPGKELPGKPGVPGPGIPLFGVDGPGGVPYGPLSIPWKCPFQFGGTGSSSFDVFGLPQMDMKTKSVVRPLHPPLLGAGDDDASLWITLTEPKLYLMSSKSTWKSNQGKRM